MTRQLKPISLRFPLGGVANRTAYQEQAPYTCVDALNIWPVDWTTGRDRGATRPALDAAGASFGGAPYGWCDATWSPTGGGVRREIAVVGSSGTYVTNGPGSASVRITTAPGSVESSCAVYLQNVFQASQGMQEVRWNDLKGAGTAGTVLGTAPVDFTAAGTPPQFCGLVRAWGDRLVLAGDKINPHVLYMSRVGNAWDWDYSDLDGGAAWASSGAEGGLISEPITSLIPHNRDCLIVGCTDSMYAVRGNPMIGGQIYMLSREVAPVSDTAWCKISNDYTMMWTRDGLYSMRGGCGEPPVSVSRELLPKTLVDIDVDGGDKISLGYDRKNRGLHILFTPASGSREQWFYDLHSAHGGFWPMSTNVTAKLAADFPRASTESKSSAYILNASGSGYQFDEDATEASMLSYYVIGPIHIGSSHSEGQVVEIRADLASGSDDVQCTMYFGDTPEQSLPGTAGTPTFVCSWWDPAAQKYLQYAQHPRMGGHAVCLKVAAFSVGERIILEGIRLLVRDAGKRRR